MFDDVVEELEIEYEVLEKRVAEGAVSIEEARYILEQAEILRRMADGIISSLTSYISRYE